MNRRGSKTHLVSETVRSFASEPAGAVGNEAGLAPGCAQIPASSKRHRLVVTGITGTLVRNLLEEVGAWKETAILALSRPTSNPKKSFPQTTCEWIDFYDKQAIQTRLKAFQPTCVIHCAASGMQFKPPAWFDMVRFNVDASLNLCEGVSRIPGCQFIYISTGLAYRDQGRPLREEDALDTQHPYGASKAAADILVRSAAAEFGVPLTVFRPFSFSGLGDHSSRLFPSLLQAAANKQTFELTSGDQARDHCAAADIAHAIALAIQVEPPAKGPARVFNIGSGSAEPLRALVQRVVEELGLDLPLKFGARPLSRFEPKHLVADITRAHAELGWQPALNFPYAIWQLAQESFPTLKLKRPRQCL